MPPNEIASYLLTIAVSAFAVLTIGLLALRGLQKFGCRQYIRREGPTWHDAKAGTPTLGGLFFIIPALIVGVVAAGFYKPVIVVAVMTLAFLLLGFSDDFIMLRRKDNLGFKARHKLIAQFLLATLFIYALEQTGRLENIVQLPFASYIVALPSWLYLPFAVLLIVLTSNATNLTDGLDGLLTSLTIIAASAFALLAYWQQDFQTALFTCALLGGALGFLYYNRHPARVFMGDTGSLALGAAFAGIALLINAEIILLLFGAVFFIEMLSVIIQVIHFKLTKRRVFKMSPLHHHLELSGWKETKIVRVFCLISIVITTLALLGSYWARNLS